MAVAGDELRSPRSERALKKARLIDQVRNVGLNRSQACVFVHVSRMTLYRWLATDPEFARGVRGRREGGH